MHSDGKVRSKCKYCLKDYVGGDNRNETSTLQRHMRKCDVYLKTRSNSDVGNIILDHAGRLRNKKIDQSVVYEMISMMIIEHDLPFSFVEHKRFKELLQYLHPHVKVPFRRVAIMNVNNLYESEKVTNAKLKVASGEKVWGYETQRDLENVHVYKKLLEDVGRRSDTLQRLNFEIDLHEKRRDYYNLVRPKKELVEEEEVPQEPFVALTSEEEDEVERAFSANRWRILVTHKNSNIEITGEKFQCLRPAGWLNDELISGPKGYDFKSVRRWTSQRNLGYSLLECDKIFVPIHQEIHWCLAVINKKDKKFQYLDSMKGEDSSVLEKLAKYFADEVNDKTGKHIDVNTWKKEFVKDLPQQKNGSEQFELAAVFDFYSRGLELCFNQVGHGALDL
ncbi:Ubiquitin-like-specific protease ESD4 [Glycine soja]|uniref:Ubiquitin-like-specific protease ESD4 n=1 Tax=Glycine soja TaxID=3848 RepID=A0A0B2Q3R0_GLYSO|nr:Ubiquitin-like-specific protease ESD4 [Glycine soja]